MDPIRLMINGVPGNMATKVLEHAVENPEFEIIPFAFTGPDITELTFKGIARNGVLTIIELIPPGRRNEIEDIKMDWMPFLSVDFTAPDAVAPNVEFYCQNALPFVMGTTGGDQKLFQPIIKRSKICAVVAPNMAKQIVAFQAMMAYAAETFPNAFKGYTLEITESHQQGKKDTSGTARAMVEYFNRLGIPFTVDQIIMVRNPEKQRNLGVPEECLKGHAWHTYTLRAEDGTVMFQFMHNVNGRDTYAEGALDALRFLQKNVEIGVKGMAFSMIDVLKGM